MLAAWWITVARADVVDEPPSDCPSGTVGRTGHQGPYCAPAPCDDACEGTCEEVGLCLTTHTSTWSGYEPYTWQEVTKTCDGPGDCTGEDTCDVGPRCVLPPTDSAVVATGRCGCGAVGAGPTVAFGLGVAVLALGRRRR
jgi:uncharacterized protein (TIGR03382 family)